MTNAITEIPAETPTADAARIAAQNDAFRRHVCLAACYGTGDPKLHGPKLHGRLVTTAAVHAAGIGFLQGCLGQIGRLEAFPAENDPDGHRDFGSVEVFGTVVWFKIDLYDDKDMNYGSEAPDDPMKTYRVLTVLFPSDW